MVTILPADINPGGMIGQALGQGFSDTYQRRNEQSYQRGLLQKSLQGVKGIMADPNKSPQEKAIAMMEAGAGIPGFEKYASTIIPLMMQQSSMQPAANVPGPGGQGPSSAASGQPRGQMPTQGQAPNLGAAQGEMQGQAQLPEWIGKPQGDAFPGALEPTALGMGPLPNVYTPDEIRYYEQQSLQRGIDPGLVTQQLDNYNNRARQQVQDLVTGAKTHSEVSEARAERQKQSREILQSVLGDISPENLAVAETIAQRPEFALISNDQIRAQRVKEEYDRYDSAKQGFEEISARYNFDATRNREQKNNLRSQAAILVRNGQSNLARSILEKNGWGPVEADEIINLMPEELISGAEKLPKIVNPLDQITVTADDPKFDEQFMKVREKNQKAKDKYKTFIEDNWETGTVNSAGILEPGTSLLQLRDAAMKNGLSWQDFETIVADLERSGRIKLDKYQEDQKTRIAQSPEQALGFWEIMSRGIPFYQPRK